MDYYYDAKKQGALARDMDFYARIADSQQRKLVKRDVIPIRTGHAWEARAGQVFRVIDIEGAQVGDFNLWNLNNPREHFWSVRTRQFEGAHLSTGSRMWSCLPYLRPMVTI